MSDGFPVWSTAGPDRMIIALAAWWVGMTVVAALLRKLKAGPDA